MATPDFGDVVQVGDVFPANLPNGCRIATLNRDGSRQVGGTLLVDPGMTFTQTTFDLFPHLADGILILAGPGYAPGGSYLPYYGSTYTPSVNVHGQDTPVNPIPYVLRWKRILGDIAHDFVQPSDEIFHHETHATGWSPHTVSLTTEQQQKFEVVNRNVRRLVGLHWGRILDLEAMDASASDAWKAVKDTRAAEMAKLCETCHGRGFKRRLLRRVNAQAWARLHGISQSSIFYPNATTDPESWGVGDLVRATEAEYYAVIPNFQRALIYHEDSTGTEDSHTLPGDPPVPRQAVPEHEH